MYKFAVWSGLIKNLGISNIHNFPMLKTPTFSISQGMEARNEMDI